MVIILHHHFALKRVLVAINILRGVRLLKAVEIEERHRSPSSGMSRPPVLWIGTKVSETQPAGLVQGGRLNRENVTGTVSGGRRWCWSPGNGYCMGAD